jgi:hypothetical protein
MAAFGRYRLCKAPLDDEGFSGCSRFNCRRNRRHCRNQNDPNHFQLLQRDSSLHQLVGEVFESSVVIFFVRGYEGEVVENLQPAPPVEVG